MEFSFNLAEVLPGKITIIYSKNSSSIFIYDLEERNQGNGDATWIYSSSANTSWNLKLNKKKEELENVIDSIGMASSQAQNLRTPITSFSKMLQCNQQKLYIMKDVEKPNHVIGMLKVGFKRLFVRDNVGAHHEVDPLCVLDFYIHESKQRCGFGHELFDIMLKTEGLTPEKLAIDRPSDKCLRFLQKHYSLNDPIQQNNNFVIYPGFLQDRSVTRPPIFLYSTMVVPASNSNARQKNGCKTSDFVHSLQSVPISMCAEDIKCKAYNSGKLLNLKNCEGNQEKYRKQKVPDQASFPSDHTQENYRKVKAPDLNTTNTTPNLNRGEYSGVREAMHGYTSSLHNPEDWNSFSTNRYLTPVDSTRRGSQNQWDLQSSWNILGVKPIDYSPIPKKS